MLLAGRTRVVETWVGRSQATRSYIAADDGVAYPSADDSGELVADFGVDELGHVYTIGRCWTCPSCKLVRCRACLEVGELAPCRSCGQAACGACRSAPPSPVEPESCELCLARSCSACHRVLNSRACPVCSRQACEDCWAGSTCRACQSLVPASEDQVASLPAELGAVGLHVVLNCTGEVTVAALVGATRRELAVIDRGVVRSWWALEEEPATHRALRMGLAVRHGVTDSAVTTNNYRGAPRVRGFPLLDVVSADVTWRPSTLTGM